MMELLPPTDKAHLTRLYQESLDSDIMSTAQVWNLGGPVNEELLLLTQLSCHNS